MEKIRGRQGQSPKPKRTAKDTVFTSLFRNKEYLLQLYQALHPEDTETGEDDLTVITLENIMAGGIYNDLNIPAVKANELRLDNLFELEDNTVAVVDYESDYDKADKIKYLNYITGIASRYQNEKKDCPTLRMIVIYTGDINRRQVSNECNIGAVKINTETAFLSELDGESILHRLEGKVHRHEMLTDEELMEFIILPLSYRKREEFLVSNYTKDDVETLRRKNTEREN